MTTDDLTRLYPYTLDDVEGVRASEIREGDLLAFWGPQDCGRLSGDRVLSAGYGGQSKLGGERYLIVYRQANSGRESKLLQPESMPVWRVRKDRTKRGAV